MTCDRALEALLEVDLPDALRGRGPIAVHLQSCKRCRSVADMMVSETRMLARAVAVAPHHAKRSPSMLVLPMAAAAALLVMVATRATERAPDRAAVSMLAPILVEPPLVEPSAVEPARPTLRAFPRATPVAAVKLDIEKPAVAEIAAAASTTPGVTVTPPAGTRAVVMQTNDPRLVVVWLY